MRTKRKKKSLNGVGIFILAAVAWQLGWAAIPFAVAAGAGALAATIWASTTHPNLPPGHFFAGRGRWLPIIGGAGALAAWAAIEAARIHDYPDLVWLSFLFFAAVWLVVDIIEDRRMKSILTLVPTDQQPGLDQFLSGGKPTKTTGTALNLAKLDPEKVREKILARVIGQDDAVDESLALIFRRARLARAAKPVCTIMLVGATGAGKTELAKALAAELCSGRMIRIDCAEMTQSHANQRLIGAPPGYQGSEQGGWLCRELEQKKTGVLLLDEIEKAHPDVLTTLMALFDEARITEQSTGQTYSARGFIIVLTSNAAAPEIAKIVTDQPPGPSRAGAIKDELKKSGFKPEVLGRLDKILPFSSPTRRDVAEIIGLTLARLAEEIGIKIERIDAEIIVDLIKKKEQMEGYGVREITRFAEAAVMDQLIDEKDAGWPAVAIRVVDGEINVEGIGQRSL